MAFSESGRPACCRHEHEDTVTKGCVPHRLVLPFNQDYCSYRDSPTFEFMQERQHVTTCPGLVGIYGRSLPSNQLVLGLNCTTRNECSVLQVRLVFIGPVMLEQTRPVLA